MKVLLHGMSNIRYAMQGMQVENGMHRDTTNCSKSFTDEKLWSLTSLASFEYIWWPRLPNETFQRLNVSMCCSHIAGHAIQVKQTNSKCHAITAQCLIKKKKNTFK